MSYPNVIYRDYGAEKTTYAAKPGNMPLGQLMILPDGRKFRLAKAAAVALEAGVIVSASAATIGYGGVAGSGLLASVTTTHNLAGDTDVYLDLNSVAMTKDLMADGWLNIQGPAASTYIGYTYRIKSNESAAVSSLCKFTLESTDPLKVSLAPVSTTCSLRESPYKNLIVRTASVVAPVTGSTPTAVSASHFFWVQRGGEASLQQGATVVTTGEGVYAASAEAGSVTTFAVTAATGVLKMGVLVGQALEGATASEAVFTTLMLE